MSKLPTKLPVLVIFILLIILTPRQAIYIADDFSQTQIVSGNTLLAPSMPVLLFTSYGSLIGDDMVDLLDCMWEKESSRGKNMIGDLGLAIGHYQIHISKHPEVSYWCAMDYECSKSWTARQIKEGNGGWWTTYKICLKVN